MPAVEINAATFQDAYHYALAAAGDDDSQFYFEGPRSKEGVTRREYLARACDRLEMMGFAVRSPRSLSGAREFAENIANLARHYGFSAYGGVRLCQECGQEHPTADHAYETKQAAARLA